MSSSQKVPKECLKTPEISTFVAILIKQKVYRIAQIFTVIYYYFPLSSPNFQNVERTRNQFASNRTRVRIPPSPPKARFLLLQKPRFLYSFFLFFLHPAPVYESVYIVYKEDNEAQDHRQIADVCNGC